MKKQSRTVARRRQSVSPSPRHLPLVDILIDTQAELQELVVASGLKVLEAMLEEDRAAVCGPRYAHQPARQAYRAGHAPNGAVEDKSCVSNQEPWRVSTKNGLDSVGAPSTITRHHERHRESAQPHAPCEAECETVARRDDGAALGGRRRDRSREGVPSGERVQRYADARRRPPGA